MLPVLTQLDDLKASKSYTNGVFYGSVDYRLFFYNNVDCSLDAEIEALRYTHSSTLQNAHVGKNVQKDTKSID